MDSYDFCDTQRRDYAGDKSEYLLVERLTAKQMTVAVCESCTGGLISKRITNVPGASRVFGYGLCTYANEAKIKLLGVKRETLEKYGAVSENTALEMAEGMIALSGADLAVSTTGIAGPGGGSEEKPVGLVYIGICAKDGFRKVKRMQFGALSDPSRENIRHAASCEALLLALEYLEQIR